MAKEVDWRHVWSQADDRCRQLMARLLEVEEERDDARREYRRSDVVICTIQAWLAKPKASRAELRQRMEALGVEVSADD